MPICRIANSCCLSCYGVGHADLGYSRREACRIFAHSSGLRMYRPDDVASKHHQLRQLLQATPSDVRGFVLKQPGVLNLNVSGGAFSDRVQLWKEESDRPLRSLLAFPMLFHIPIKQSAARIGLMRERGHVMTSSSRELLDSPASFFRRLEISQETFDQWHQAWLQTSMGQRYGS